MGSGRNVRREPLPATGIRRRTNKGESSLMHKNIILLVVTLALFASLAPAQTITASITGNASDPSGATVPNGAVTATNTETNVRTTTTTNSEGIRSEERRV